MYIKVQPRLRSFRKRGCSNQKLSSSIARILALHTCALHCSSPELTYQAEFTEELPHGEVVTQMWPVAPYQVHLRHRTDILS
jgi:hypothetical protein